MDVILSQDAQKQYKKLPEREQSKIRKKLNSLKYSPYSGKKLEGELKGRRSLRAWPYRIIYNINEAKQIIEIVRIAHRQGAYK